MANYRKCTITDCESVTKHGTKCSKHYRESFKQKSPLKFYYGILVNNRANRDGKNVKLTYSEYESIYNTEIGKKILALKLDGILRGDIIPIDDSLPLSVDNSTFPNEFLNQIF